MSGIYVYVDTKTNLIKNVSYGPPEAIPAGEEIIYTEDTIPNALEAAHQPQNYYFLNGNICELPFLTAEYANGVLTVNLNNATGSIFTVPGANVEVLGKTFALNFTNDAAAIQLQLHPSIQEYTIPVSVTGANAIATELNIGGGLPSTIGLQIYTKADGVTQEITPAGTGSVDYLCAFWTSTIPPLYLLPDIATIVNMLTETVYGEVVPALTCGSTPLLTLSDNKKNTMAIMGKILPDITTTLENAAPLPAAGQPQTYEPHFANYLNHMPIVTAAMKNFATDLLTIPNLA